MNIEVDPNTNKKDLVLLCIDKLTQEEVAMELFLLEKGYMSSRFTTSKVPEQLLKESEGKVSEGWIPEEWLEKYGSKHEASAAQTQAQQVFEQEDSGLEVEAKLGEPMQQSPPNQEKMFDRLQ